MSIQPSYPNRPQNNGKAFAGLILLCVGSLLLLRQFDFFFFPGWLFSFPMLLIAVGFFYGFKHDFKNPAWLIMVLVGLVFLSGHIMPWFNLRQFIWPIVIIGIGLWLIIRRNHSPRFGKKEQLFNKDAFSTDKSAFSPEADYIVKPDGFTPPPADENNIKGEDYVDSLSIFGGVKKTILSKNFKGGEIVNIFGGSELDLTRADINGVVIVEVIQLFGAIKLVVPPHWQVRSDMAAIFAGIDDKRFGNGAVQSPDKLLILKGTSIFAGVDIRSF